MNELVYKPHNPVFITRKIVLSNKIFTVKKKKTNNKNKYLITNKQTKLFIR